MKWYIVYVSLEIFFAIYKLVLFDKIKLPEPVSDFHLDLHYQFLLV